MKGWEPLKVHTFAFAFSYALVHARAKSGTSAGLSTGGGCLGELARYTPGTGGSEDGDGKGEKAYRVTGMTDGPGSVNTLLLAEGDDDCGERVDSDSDDDDDDDDDGVESEGVAKARAAAKRMMMTAEGHMNVEPVDLILEDRERAGLSQPRSTAKGEENRKEEL